MKRLASYILVSRFEKKMEISGHTVAANLFVRLANRFGKAESGHIFPDSKVHGASMGPTWGRQDPDGPHDGLMNFAIWVKMYV